MALPQNAPKALKSLGVLVDDIWYYAGDRSVDVSIVIYFVRAHVWLRTADFWLLFIIKWFMLQISLSGVQVKTYSCLAGCHASCLADSVLVHIYFVAIELIY